MSVENMMSFSCIQLNACFSYVLWYLSIFRGFCSIADKNIPLLPGTITMKIQSIIVPDSLIHT